jgi:adenosylhomocysteine nucleosidase
MPPPATIALIAALPREIASLVQGTAADPTLIPQGVWLYRLDEAVIVAAGMGAERAAVAVEAARSAAPGLKLLVSVGLAGACIAGLGAGSVVEAGTVVDAATGETFPAASGSSSTLATTAAIASVAEKARLAQTFGAAIVDMEAATVARIALTRGLSFRAIKGVSDAHDFELSALGKFEGRQGSFRTGAFAFYTAIRPWTWARAIRLGSGSTKALKSLDAALRDLIAPAAPTV